MDAQSPLLFEAAAYGYEIPTIIIYLEHSTEKTIEVYATYTFTKCYISSVRPGGGGGSENPLEEVSFNYGKVSYEYKKH